eukprot:TRINITY_DN17121_c0_g1_i3.p3 TRINITY_DN17121_c0_g1~~TRINITY_DN17121_c0_g1_i3.p3  ORF type:complete len:120 (+),score=22.41 TRINITY_DN17121_c0_g1_i3:61-420(+)
MRCSDLCCRLFFFFNDTATTEIYTRSIVGSVRCVQETGVEVLLFEEYRPEKKAHTESYSLPNYSPAFALVDKDRSKTTVGVFPLFELEAPLDILVEELELAELASLLLVGLLCFVPMKQ